MATTTPAAEINVFAYRKTARRKAWVCPGAGFAYLGRPAMAALCYLSSIGTFVAAIATAIVPSQTLLLATIAFIIAGTVLWGLELFSTYTAWPPASLAPSSFNPWLGALAIWIAVAIFAVVVLNSYKLVAFGGSLMSPTISEDESLLFHRSVDDARLQRGNVVLFELDADNKITEPGTLMIGRIIAVPGDMISISKERYVINGQIERHVAPSEHLPIALQVPQSPRMLKVPADCFFVSQDSITSGYDSRVLAYAKRPHIVSTKLFHFGKPPFLHTIE
ncbi:MAG: signal peptidase I [Planctomycetia bacterium]|nr:signal peptidase I [Planctomycetia bacterium]